MTADSGVTSDDGVDEVVDACRRAGVRLVRFLYCDNGGVIRGKEAHVTRLADRIRTGIGLTKAMMAMNSLDQLQPVAGMGPVGEVRLVPDPTTLVMLPYVPNAAAMLCDHVSLEGRPWEVSPRGFLSRMNVRLAERDMSLLSAVENEYSLAREQDGAMVPVDSSLCFSTVGMNASAEVADATVAALEEQGIQVEQYYVELGHGQQELSCSPRSVLAAADSQILVRETIRGVASQHGLAASMAPKPWPNQAGNGAHIHFSLWDGAAKVNLFHDPSGRFGLSSTAEHFLAGILAHLPALLGLTAPSFNSYQRLVAQNWASAFVGWGPDNREASVRVPSQFWGVEHVSTNLEYKPADTTCNPYIAFGGLIAAGLDGIDRQLQPPEPVMVDPASLSPSDREAAGLRPYPATLAGALAALEEDEVLMGALGDQLSRSYLAVRRSEWDVYSVADEAFVYRNHFDKY